MASCIEDLKKENENYQNKISELNNSLCFYKKLVKTEKEGLTMQFDCRRPEGRTHVSLIFIERHINSSSNLATLVDSLRQVFFAKNLDSLLVELVGPTNNYISRFIYSQTCLKGHLYITNHLFIKESLIFPINE